MPTQTTKPPSRLDTLDALRALACALVIWHHTAEAYQAVTSSGQWALHLAAFADFGRIGVVAFFCISGFVIPSSLRGSRLAAVRSFALSRILRLYPVYWLALAASIFGAWTLWDRSPTTAQILRNATMLPSAFAAEPLLGHFWTLEVELLFYFTCAALYLIFGHLRFPLLAATCLLSYILYKNNPLSTAPGIFPALFLHLSIMFAAATGRAAYDSLKSPSTIRTPYTIPIAILLLLLVLQPALKAAFRIGSDPEIHWVGFALGNGLGILLFLAFLFLPRVPKIFPALGRSTYSVYLFHAPIFYLALRLWLNHDLSPAPLELIIAASLILCFALAAIPYHLLEKPSHRLARKIFHPRSSS